MNLITILTENMIRFRTKNITPANLKTILDKSPIVINEYGIKNSLLTEGVSEGKRCWYYNQLAKKKYVTDSRVPNPSNGKGVQDFLIAIGHNIKSDGSFGNETAKALATWRYGGGSGIDTVDKLWNKLKSNGYNVGTTSGYGTLMKSGVAEMIIATCINLAKSCVIDAQTSFEMIKFIPRDMKDQLDSSFTAAIKYWKDYLNNINVQKKISVNLYGSANLTNMIKTQKNIIPSYMSVLDKIKKNGWEERTADAEAADATMFVGANCPDFMVCVNLDVFLTTYKQRGIEIMGVDAKNTFVHEMQHIMWTEFEDHGKLINPQANIKLAFPLAYDSHAPSSTSTSKQLVQAQISQSSKNDLAANGIDYNELIAYYSTEYWKDAYTCYETELMSRLASYREYLTDRNVIQTGGTILLKTICSDINKIINHYPVHWNFKEMIGCWVLGGMTPNLTDFVNKLNALAKNNIQDKNNVDFNQLDQDERT